MSRMIELYNPLRDIHEYLYRRRLAEEKNMSRYIVSAAAFDTLQSEFDFVPIKSLLYRSAVIFADQIFIIDQHGVGSIIYGLGTYNDEQAQFREALRERATRLAADLALSFNDSLRYDNRRVMINSNRFQYNSGEWRFMSSSPTVS